MCEGEGEEAGKRVVLLAYPELSWGGTEWSSLAAGYEHEPPKAAAYECIVLAIPSSSGVRERETQRQQLRTLHA